MVKEDISLKHSTRVREYLSMLSALREDNP